MAKNVANIILAAVISVLRRLRHKFRIASLKVMAILREVFHVLNGENIIGYFSIKIQGNIFYDRLVSRFIFRDDGHSCRDMPAVEYPKITGGHRVYKKSVLIIKFGFYLHEMFS